MGEQIKVEGRISLDAMPVPLSNYDQFCWVDPADWEWALSMPWSGRKAGQIYARTSVYSVVTKRQKSVSMHVMIAKRAGKPAAEVIDHADRNALNNTRSNLRPATAVQNQANTPRRVTNSSGYKGVHWDASSKAWRARLFVGGTRKCLGLHRTAEAAARVYDAWAKELHGDFAVLNLPEEWS